MGLKGFKLHLHREPFPSEFIERLVELSVRVFDRVEPDYVAWRMSRMPDVSAFVIDDSGELIGFKIGYAMTRIRYYSWLGGIHPEHRRHGLASKLMVSQHQWVTEQGYRQIETGVDQQNLAMTRLNLAHGFTTSGIRAEPDRTQILFLKDLKAKKNPDR